MTTAVAEQIVEQKAAALPGIPRLIDSALAALEERDFAEVQETCRRIVANQPAQPAAWHLLGIAALEDGNATEAIQALRRAVGLRRAKAEYHLTLGRAYREAGRLEEALETLSRARHLAPDSPDILMHLAAVQMALGRTEEAKETSLLGSRLLLRKKARRLRMRVAMLRVPFAAVLRGLTSRRCSYAAAAVLERGLICMRHGDSFTATAKCKQAVAMAPDYAPARAALGRLLLEAGDVFEAVGHLEKAAEAAPNDTRILLAYARGLFEFADWDQALRVADRVLMRDADSPAALSIKAKALVRKAMAPAAVPIFRKVRRLEPRNPEAAYGLAQCFQDMGRFEEARHWLVRTLEIDPAFSAAYPTSARHGHLNVDDPAFARMQAMLADHRTPTLDRRHLHFATALVLDRAGDADEAFAHYRRGNDLHDAVFCPDAHAAAVDGLIETYDEAFFRRTAGWGDTSDLPVFVLGMPRSGTSLIEQILASHPEVHGAGEIESFNRMALELAQIVNTDLPYPDCVERLDRETVRTLAARYLEHLRGLSRTATRITDKMPNNFMHLGLIAALLPNARVIHVQRDPMDTCVSIYSQDFEGDHPYAYDLTNLGCYYREYERLMAHWRRVLPLPLLEVRYEDIIDDLEATSRRMLKFCGLEWSPRCLAFHETERTVHTASHNQVRKPLYRNAVHRWKRYERHLEPLRAALAGRADAPRIRS